MDNGWQMKLPCLSSRVVSSSEQFQFQEPRNQMNMNTNHCILPHEAREQRPLPPQMKQAPASNILNFGAPKPIHPESGSLFHSLLSAPHSPLQYDVQRQSTMHSSSGSCILESSAQGNVGTMPNWPLLQNKPNFNTRAGVDARPILQPGPVMNANNGNSRGLSDDLDTLRAFTTHDGSKTERGINTPLQKGSNCVPSSSSALLEASLQKPSLVTKKQNSVVSDCPRVFCMGACGDLLLSSTGLFGILCSCHGMHMSVSKFCEHSGLSNVNPGYAVRVDSGESIAQWRKVYLQKFGIRAPGDHRGWDWPEGLLSSSGLANSSMAVADRRKVFDLSSLFNSSAESSTQLRKNVSTSSPRSTQECSNQMLKNAHRENNGFDHCNTGSFGKNLHNKTVSNQTIACPSLFRPPLPGENGGPGDGCLSRSFHFMSSRENSFSHAFQNLQSVGSKAKTNLKDDVVMQRSSIPSSIELKLGQPSQLGWGSGSATPSLVRPHTSGVQTTTPHTSGVQTTTVNEKLNCNMENAKVAEINKQHITCHSASDFSRSKDTFALGPLNNTATSFRAVAALTSTNGAAHVEHMKNGFHNSFATSVPGPPSNTTAGGSLYHKKITKSTTDGHPFSPWTLHQQPRVDRPVMIDFSCNEDVPIRPLDVNKLASLDNKNITMDACGHKEFSVSESSSMFYAKQMESSGFNRTRKTCNPNSSALLAASSSPLGMANMLSGVSGASTYIRNSMADNIDQDQLSSKLRNSSFSFTTPTVQATSPGFTPSSTVLNPGHGSISFNKNVEAINAHASEESIRLLALRNIDTSCNEKPMDGPHVFSHQPRIYSDQRQQSKTCNIPDSRAPVLFLDQGPFEGQRHGHPFSVGQVVPPAFLPDAGHKKGMEFGAISEKVTWWSDLAAKYNDDLCNPQLKQRSPLSGGRQVNMECNCKMVQGCHGQSSCISDMCNCNVQTVCLKREQESSGGSCMYGLNKQASIAVVETPKCNSSRFFNDVSTGNEIRLEFSHKGKEHHFKNDCGNSQWIGNPSQANSISKLRCPNAPTHIVDRRKASESNLNEHATKGTLRTNQVAELLKGKELSDNSSGCSVQAVAQASNEVNMIDSVTTNSQIADQGSAISRSCSSVEAIDSVKSSQLVYDGKTRSTEEESLMLLENASLHSEINESKQTYTKSSELQNFTMSGGSSGEVSNKVQNENEFKPSKRKCTTKWKSPETPFTAPESSFLPSESGVCAGSAANQHARTEEVQVLPQPNINSADTLNVGSSHKSLKRRRSALSSVKMLSHKRDSNWIDKGQPGDQVPWEGNDGSINMAENSAVKKLKHSKRAEAVRKQFKATVADGGNWLHSPNYDASMKCSSKSCQKLKPVAYGKYGIIRDQESDIDPLKPPKIVPLSQVLKASKRSAKYDKPMPSTRKKKKNSCSGGKRRVDISFSSHRSQINRFNKVISCHSRVIDASIQETQHMHLDNAHPDDPDVLVEIGAAGDERNLCVSTSRSAAVSKTKEIRMRSLYDLSVRGNKSISADISRSQDVMCAPPTVCGLEMIMPKDAGGSVGGESRSAGNRLCRKLHSNSLMSNTEELCCVCGISNKDNANCLLECGHCLIRIHQACYGIARVPKGDWYCRPCRTSSKDVACVLCGYGDGAMTRAFGSRYVVKGLLKAWNIRTEPNIMCVGSSEALYVPAKMECRNKLESATYQLYPSIKPVVHNSIVSGLFDPTVKQWVHMVCGLWTPGTRCPNVDTMSAFDVSSVSHLNDHMVCYICNRAGGSCIRCRVETCYTHFHPWCAHHKGLLQSEVEGDDSDQVGFYGRCLLHANPGPSCSDNDRDTDKANSETEREEEPTCARTEGYKGKKQRGGHYSSYQHKGKDGFLVTQVQLDAWHYINRHKLRGNKQPKPPVSDVDHDYRKEYTRYKQAKGWKHLVVYKSGIHALGLYTSQFIQRAAVVVEYVGEIVGPRVADKRETEYMTGRKLQYKSACYFFRIDKEQIIDATCKGGIARFVNHSCQPNCVAKVLTVRGDKKVVFFAERDIYPGEEITYDYHFNHEDEGKKIPCFCNSKNCRRYLN